MSWNHPDPHDPAIRWYWSKVHKELVHSDLPSFGWVLQSQHPLPESPERLALWIALQLEAI